MGASGLSGVDSPEDLGRKGSAFLLALGSIHLTADTAEHSHALGIKGLLERVQLIGEHAFSGDDLRVASNLLDIGSRSRGAHFVVGTRGERILLMEWMKRALHHDQLGLSDEAVLEMYRLMLTARRIDDRMFALNRQGRVPFVVGSSGHEAIQVASVFALDHDHDWLLPYYRDMGVALAWGTPPLDVFLAVFARKTDPLLRGSPASQPLVRSPPPDLHPVFGDRHSVSARGRHRPGSQARWPPGRDRRLRG